MFINIYSTTCFDPNGSSSGAAHLTHSTTELQRAQPLGSKHVVLYMLINNCWVDGRIGIYQLGRILNEAVIAFLMNSASEEDYKMSDEIQTSNKNNV
jgi:hypothetical protein